MQHYTDNLVMTKAINGFSLNMGEWFYEGQTVNIEDNRLGMLKNVLISTVDGRNDQVFVTDSKGLRHRFHLSTIRNITIVEKRRKVVNL